MTTTALIVGRGVLGLQSLSELAGLAGPVSKRERIPSERAETDLGPNSADKGANHNPRDQGIAGSQEWRRRSTRRTAQKQLHA